MKKKIVITIFVFLLTTFLLTILSTSARVPVLAQVSCPSNIPPNSVECLDYLRNQANALEKEQIKIQKRLSNEEYQQLSLQEKIEYIKNQIEQSEKVIQSLQVEIAANDIEIKLLEKGLTEKEDNISLLRQEIDILEETVNQRITESYKYSFLSTFELLLDIENFSSALRKAKYLASTREKDKQYLENYSFKVQDLREEEKELAESRAKIQIKRNSIEEEKIKLAENQKVLDGQKKERESLLAQSKAMQAKLQAEYEINLKRLSDLDSAIIAYIAQYGDQARNQGPVSAGDWIGRMGNTGISSGAHLHFSIRQSWSGNPCSGTLPILSGYLIQGERSPLGPSSWRYPYMYAGSLRLPIAGPKVVMSQDYHQGTAIDLVSYKSDLTPNLGAPIYAVMEGTLYKAVDGYGGVYAYIRHPNGWTSCYLHLQN